MNISSVGSAYTSLQTQAVQRQPESAEVQQASKDKDGDSDDGSTTVAAPKPTVNLNNQKLGSIINVIAS
jgi:hypothetical protein